MADHRRGIPVVSRVWPRFAADDRLVGLVRRGDATAFEILYDRHCGELLSFCRYLLGSQHDAEDAVQSTFASAYRALLTDERPVDLRPWLFTIARNACLSIMRQRRNGAELGEASAQREDPVAQLEQNEDLRQMLAALIGLPERQKTALVLAEMHGLSQREIGALLGVRTEQVKSYIYQARSSLISERRARSADCLDIRQELASARGAALLKSHLRRHLSSCAGCRDYAGELSRQRRQLGILAPLIPSLALKHRALRAALGKAPGTGACASTTAGASSVGVTADLAAGGVKTLVAKLLAGVAAVGTSTGAGVGTLLVGGTLLLGVAATHPWQAASTSSHGRVTQLRLTADTGAAASGGPVSASSPSVDHLQTGGGLTGTANGRPTVHRDHGLAQAAQSGGAANAGAGHGHGGGTAHEHAASPGNSASHSHGNSTSHDNSASLGHGNGASHGKGAANGKGAGHGNSASHGKGSSAKPGNGSSASHGNGATHVDSAGHGKGSAGGAGTPTPPAHGSPPDDEAKPQNPTTPSISGGPPGGGAAEGHGEQHEPAGAANGQPNGGSHGH